MKFDKVRLFNPAGFNPERGIEDIADMLRYDRAFYNETLGLVATMRWKGKGAGFYSNAPTFRRWESFGVYLSEQPAVLEMERGAWFTCRNGKDGLVRVSLEDVIAADDWNDI